MNGRAVDVPGWLSRRLRWSARGRWLACRGPDRPPSRGRVSLMRAGRSSTIVCALAVAGSVFLAAPATAAPAWGPQRTVDTWAWSSGSSFARTSNGDLVALEATDFSQGAFATDHGPYMGVF